MAARSESQRASRPVSTTGSVGSRSTADTPPVYGDDRGRCTKAQGRFRRSSGLRYPGIVRNGSVNDGLSGFDEEKAEAAGVFLQPEEGVVDAEASPLGDHAFGLLDHDAAAD